MINSIPLSLLNQVGLTQLLIKGGGNSNRREAEKEKEKDEEDHPGSKSILTSTAGMFIRVCLVVLALLPLCAALAVGLSALQLKFQKKLEGARFRAINEKLYSCRGEESFSGNLFFVVPVPVVPDRCRWR